MAGHKQPGPAPRFSRTQPEVARPAAHPGQNTDEALAEWGIENDEIGRLRDAKAIA